MKGGDCVVETEDADLAEEIGGRPGDRKNSERYRSKQSRDQNGEDRPEVRGDHRDGVEERAAFQLRAGLVGAPRKIDRFGCGLKEWSPSQLTNVPIDQVKCHGMMFLIYMKQTMAMMMARNAERAKTETSKGEQGRMK